MIEEMKICALGKLYRVRRGRGLRGMNYYGQETLTCDAVDTLSCAPAQAAAA